VSEVTGTFLSFASAFGALVAVVAIITFSLERCSLQETEIRKACIQACGSVIGGQNGGSFCIRPPAPLEGVKP